MAPVKECLPCWRGIEGAGAQVRSVPGEMNLSRLRGHFEAEGVRYLRQRNSAVTCPSRLSFRFAAHEFAGRARNLLSRALLSRALLSRAVLSMRAGSSGGINV